MSRPAGAARFGERLDWLLRSVPRRPGAPERFDIDDVIDALVGTAPPTTRSATRAGANAWLLAMRTGQLPGTTPAARRNLAVLEDLFRLPPGYFTHEPTQQLTDARILFAADAAERGVTVFGPCRAQKALFTLESLDWLHREVRRELDRRGSS